VKLKKGIRMKNRSHINIFFHKIFTARNSFFLFFFLFLFFIDWVTKHTVQKYFFYGEKKKIFDLFNKIIFNLVYVRNKGVSFGFLSDKINSYKLALALSFVSFLIVLFLFYMLLKTRSMKEKFCYIFTISGSLGNIFDRVTSGSVVDFVQIGLSLSGKTHCWPAFNMADSFIFLGVFGLIIMNFFKTTPRNKYF
jgi:signal peptidase II